MTLQNKMSRTWDLLYSFFDHLLRKCLIGDKFTLRFKNDSKFEKKYVYACKTWSIWPIGSIDQNFSFLSSSPLFSISLLFIKTSLFDVNSYNFSYYLILESRLLYDLKVEDILPPYFFSCTIWFGDTIHQSTLLSYLALLYKKKHSQVGSC